MATLETEVTTATSTRERAQPYRLLGGFRLFLALLVLVSHSSAFIPVQPLALGNVGVLMFFVVSGFVIAEALDLFYRDKPVQFLLNRGLKIFPAYWAALPLAFASLIATGHPLPGSFEVLTNVALFPGYLPAGNNLLWISITWAVLVEFQFYILAAAVTAFARYLPSRTVIALALVGALVLFGLVEATHADHRFYGAFRFAPFFVAGVSAYLFIGRRERGSALLLLVSAVLSGDSYYLYNAPTAETAVAVSLAIFLACFALFLALVHLDSTSTTRGVDRLSGDLSYPVYLVHMPLITLVAQEQGTGPSAVIIVGLITFALALLVHALVERPLRVFRTRVRGFAL